MLRKIHQQDYEKYCKAFRYGYFSKLEPNGKIDFVDYDLYHKMCEKFGYKSLHPEDNTSDDSDTDDE